jgi:hypothetical protein
MCFLHRLILLIFLIYINNFGNTCTSTYSKFHTRPYHFCTLGLIIYPEDAGIRFHRNVPNYSPNYTVSHPRRSLYDLFSLSTVCHFQVNQYISVWASSTAEQSPPIQSFGTETSGYTDITYALRKKSEHKHFLLPSMTCHILLVRRSLPTRSTKRTLVSAFLTCVTRSEINPTQLHTLRYGYKLHASGYFGSKFQFK